MSLFYIEVVALSWGITAAALLIAYMEHRFNQDKNTLVDSLTRENHGLLQRVKQLTAQIGEKK